jgi:hypothetical protein
MTIRMLVTEETPSKLILKTNQEYKQMRDQVPASGSKNIMGCVVLVIILISFLSISIIAHTWQFWLWTTIFLVTSMVFISFQISFINFNKSLSRDITIAIDLVSRRAIRIDKLKSGTEEHSQIKLNDISRVLIDVQEHGHSCKLVFESQSNEPFEVNSSADFEAEPIKEIGQKLGRLLNKPVVLKVSEGNKVESEEEV